MKNSIVRWPVSGCVWLLVAASWASAQTQAPVPPTSRATDAPGSTPTEAAADIEPRVNTSAPAGQSVKPRVSTAAGASTRNAGRTNTDRIDLDNTQITGNRELPKVLYIVPWKRPELGDLVGRPLNSLLDEVLAPVDREVFRRENRYFDALQSASPTGDKPAVAPAVPAVSPAAAPSSGSVPAPGPEGQPKSQAES